MKKLIITFLVLVIPNLSYGEVFNLVCVTWVNNSPREKQIYVDSVNKSVKMNEEKLKIQKFDMNQSFIKYQFPDNILDSLFRTHYVTISRVTGSYQEAVVNDKDWKDQFILDGKCEPRKQNKF